MPGTLVKLLSSALNPDYRPKCDHIDSFLNQAISVTEIKSISYDPNAQAKLLHALVSLPEGRSILATLYKDWSTKGPLPGWIEMESAMSLPQLYNACREINHDLHTLDILVIRGFAPGDIDVKYHQLKRRLNALKPHDELLIAIATYIEISYQEKPATLAPIIENVIAARDSLQNNVDLRETANYDRGFDSNKLVIFPLITSLVDAGARFGHDIKAQTRKVFTRKLGTVIPKKPENLPPDPGALEGCSVSLAAGNQEKEVESNDTDRRLAFIPKAAKESEVAKPYRQAVGRIEIDLASLEEEKSHLSRIFPKPVPVVTFRAPISAFRKKEMLEKATLLSDVAIDARIAPVIQTLADLVAIDKQAPAISISIDDIEQFVANKAGRGAKSLHRPFMRLLAGNITNGRIATLNPMAIYVAKVLNGLAEEIFPGVRFCETAASISLRSHILIERAKSSYTLEKLRT